MNKFNIEDKVIIELYDKKRDVIGEILEVAKIIDTQYLGAKDKYRYTIQYDPTCLVQYRLESEIKGKVEYF